MKYELVSRRHWQINQRGLASARPNSFWCLLGKNAAPTASANGIAKDRATSPSVFAAAGRRRHLPPAKSTTIVPCLYVCNLIKKIVFPAQSLHWWSGQFGPLVVSHRPAKPEHACILESNLIGNIGNFASANSQCKRAFARFSLSSSRRRSCLTVSHLHAIECY